jgi:hypothetical protein
MTSFQTRPKREYPLNLNAGGASTDDAVQGLLGTAQWPSVPPPRPAQTLPPAVTHAGIV